MIRIALIVVAIAAGAFALNLFLFDAADSTGSAGRLSPRADDLPLPTVTTERPGRRGDDDLRRHDDRRRHADRRPRTTTAPDDRSDDRGSDDRSDDRGSDDSSGRGSGGDDDGGGGRGRGRGRGGDDD